VSWRDGGEWIEWTQLSTEPLLAAQAGSAPALGKLKTILGGLLALAIIVDVARGVSLEAFWRGLSQAHWPLFLLAAVASFTLWLLADSLLMARLFSYFHRPFAYSEMLVGVSTQHFLQLVNTALAASALVLFVHRRREVPLLAAGCTLAFQTFVDIQTLAVMELLAALLLAPAPLLLPWYYSAAGCVLAGGLSVLCMSGRPRWKPARWLYDRPSLTAIRQARLRHYAVLMSIRLATLSLQAILLYVEMRAFGIMLSPGLVLASIPAIVILAALPLTPLGLGSTQALFVYGFQAVADRGVLLALSMAIGAMDLLLRIPLGIALADVLGRDFTLAPRAPACATRWDAENAWERM